MYILLNRPNDRHRGKLIDLESARQNGKGDGAHIRTERPLKQKNPATLK